MNNNTKVTFYGGAGSVTGSNFMYESRGVKILVDCGLFQGHTSFEKNANDFKYDVSSVDYLFITHAHIDHIGRVAKIVKDGFRGQIISTDATRDIAELMLEDAFRVMSFHHKKEGSPMLYDDIDIANALSKWRGITYHKEVMVADDLKVSFYDAGHVLGSAMVLIDDGGTRTLFTGDLGASPNILLRPTEIPKNVDYLMMETVYGDRLHEDNGERAELLKNAIEKVRKNNGVLMIPTFSLERSQELLKVMDTLIEGGAIKPIDTYLDSPLAIKLTEIYKRYGHYMSEEISKEMEHDNVFSFNKLKLARSREDSMKINHSPNPKVIMAGSGMSHGGRILHHEMHYLDEPKNVLLFVGYQGAGTMGRQMIEGAKEVSIFGRRVKIKAEIMQISGFSGHKDKDQLFDFLTQVNTASNGQLKKVYCILGENQASQFFAQMAGDYLNIKAFVPEPDEVADLF